MTPSPSSSPATLADGRWALLRAALSGRRPEECPSKSASIHGFPGWNLIEKRPCRGVPSYPSGAGSLECSTASLQMLKREILARQCMGGDEGSFQIKHDSDDGDLKSLREDLGRRGILARKRNEDGLLHVQWSYCSYVGMEYYLPSSSVIRVRERKPQRKVALSELMSHALHQGVDNTGQTCVWDSEATLTYFLTQDSSSLRQALRLTSPLSVMEVGVGMAGLAGMALAKQCGAQVLLTDGHPVAVENNQINIRMNRLEDCVRCEQLLWSTNVTVHQEEFDLVLCSDCTHFTEHHDGLLVTLAHVLCVGGVAVLCQPSRTGTLERFLALCQDIVGLWKLEILSDENMLNSLHQESCSNPSYDPNLHCPSIILLTKQRSLSHQDRQRVTELHHQR